MPTYKQNKASIGRYMARMDEIRVRMSKESGLKQQIQAHAASLGESVNAFVLRAIRETIMRDQHGSGVLDGETPPAIQAYMDDRSL